MRKTLPIAAALVLIAGAARAQELEPRAYAASPVGANFAAVGYGYSTGAVVFDPSVPLTDVEAWVNSAVLGYGRTFGVGGVQALITGGLPLVRGAVSGKVMERDSSTTRTGVGDLRAKLSVNFFGSPALAPREFAAASRSRVITGAALTMIAPTGQYFANRLINIGTHRWSFKPEVGVSYGWRQKLYVESYAGVWLYTANYSFYPGSNTRQQQPLTTLQGHLSYTFKPRDWVAFDYTWYAGGASSTNGGPAAGRLENSRVGGTVAIGVTPRQSIKLTISNGATGRLGTNFRTVGVAYQVLWF
jgi:hypothetical protein